jgi:pimeloyl-ACP methyl ester carboxylesterase
MSEHSFIHINNRKLSYYFYDNNCSETLFLFHGFGQSSEFFQPYVVSFSPYYNIVIVDLFFHGESIVDSNTKDHISIVDWNRLFQTIVEKHFVQSFTCVAYSIGARFVNTLLQKYASQIKRIVFIAPDGFGNTLWFRIATATVFSRYLFKYVMKNPSSILLFMKVLSFLNCYNSQTIRFIERNLEFSNHREKIYNTWTYFRTLKIAQEDFVQIIKQFNILFMCLCGSQDEMVAQDVLKEICAVTNSEFIVIDLPHKKMFEAIKLQSVQNFLIFNRQ